MQPHPDEGTLAQAIDLLLDCATPHGRARILLDAVLDEGLATAAGLWRHAGRGPVQAWHPILSRGPAACLPTLAQVVAVTRGELPGELAMRGLVLTPPDDPDFALTLGEAEASADQLAQLQGLLAVWAAIERADRVTGEELLDALVAPTPADEQAGTIQLPAPDELDELLACFLAQGEPSRASAGALAEHLEFELARRVGPDTRVRWSAATVPPAPLQEEDLEDLVDHLLDGLVEGARQLAITLQPSDDLPGLCLVLESDRGWPPSLGALTTGTSREPRPATGLALAQAMARAHGGSLTMARSAFGGLRLTLWLPAAGSAPEAA